MSAEPTETAPAADAPALGEFLRSRLEELLRTVPSDRLEGLHPAILRDVERTLLETVLAHVDGRRQDAARILGLHRNTLRLRLRAVGLEDAPAERRRRS